MGKPPNPGQIPRLSRRGRVWIGAVSALFGAISQVGAPPSQTLSQTGAPKLLFVGAEVDDSTGNADAWLEPGETFNLRIKLYNDGNEQASSVFGTLDYLGTNPDVTILDKTASWPNLAA